MLPLVSCIRDSGGVVMVVVCGRWIGGVVVFCGGSGRFGLNKKILRGGGCVKSVP